MKLMHPLFSEPIRFREDCVHVLTLENPEAFRALTFDLIRQSEGANGPFVLSIDDRCVDCADHLQIITDYAHLDEIDKRLQTKYLSSIVHTAMERMSAQTRHVTDALQEYLGALSLLCDHPIAFERSENLLSLLKAMDFRVDLSGLSVHEALYERLSLFASLTKQPCFVLIHVKSLLSSRELEQLYQMVLYQKWNLLLVEAADSPCRLPCEKHLLFDADLCELRT